MSFSATAISLTVRREIARSIRCSWCSTALASDIAPDTSDDFDEETEVGTDEDEEATQIGTVYDIEDTP